MRRSVEPTARTLLAGATAMATSLGAVVEVCTLTVVDPVTAPTLAEIRVDPALTPDTTPAADTVAAAMEDEDHAALAVTLAVEPSP